MRGITKTPGVCGGKACVEGTEIPVWIIELRRMRGYYTAEIVEMYPSLTPEQVRIAYRYARAHWQEINQAIEGFEKWQSEREEGS
jgi:uncharacterized protein (DUF433 family)